MASDATLAGWLAEYDDRRTAAADLTARNKKLWLERILPELQRRDAVAVEVSGFKARRKTRTTRHYSPQRMKDRLGRRRVFLDLFKPDPSAIRRARDEGKLTAEDDAYILDHLTESDPYLELDRTGA